MWIKFKVEGELVLLIKNMLYGSLDILHITYALLISEMMLVEKTLMKTV